jgi:8-oxo-dGTP pyrophosphatase MutT (NUDIX family)
MAAPNGEAPVPPRWRLLSSAILHRSRLFDVLRDSVTRPDGSADVYEHVATRGSVAVLALDASDRVAVTRQWIYTHGSRQWRLPGGGIDLSDRSPLAAAGRELAEETGVRARKWESIGAVHGADVLSNHVEHAFRATELTIGEVRLERSESDLELHWLSFAQVLGMVTDGQLPHAASTYAILMDAVRRAGQPTS